MPVIIGFILEVLKCEKNFFKKAKCSVYCVPEIEDQSGSGGKLPLALALLQLQAPCFPSSKAACSPLGQFCLAEKTVLGQVVRQGLLSWSPLPGCPTALWVAKLVCLPTRPKNPAPLWEPKR